MKIIDLEQGTEQWLIWRATKCCASEAAVIMGCAPSWSPVKTWDDLRMQKAGLGEPRSDFLERAAERGHRMEGEARNLYLPGTKPACIESIEDDRFSASLDALGGGLWGEIKCPISGERSKLWRGLTESSSNEPKQKILPYIWWQLVHQAGMINDPDTICHLIVYLSESYHTSVSITSTELLEDWPELKEKWLQFLAGESTNRNDRPWVMGASEWLIAKDDFYKAKQRLDKAKTYLLNLGVGRGSGVVIAQHERQGSVDWRRVAKELWNGHTDHFEPWAEAYRKETSSITTIKATKGES